MVISTKARSVRRSSAFDIEAAVRGRSGLSEAHLTIVFR